MNYNTSATQAQFSYETQLKKFYVVNVINAFLKHIIRITTMKCLLKRCWWTWLMGVTWIEFPFKNFKNTFGANENLDLGFVQSNVHYKFCFKFFLNTFKLLLHCVLLSRALFLLWFVFTIHLSSCYSLGQHFGCHSVSYVID